MSKSPLRKTLQDLQSRSLKFLFVPLILCLLFCIAQSATVRVDTVSDVNDGDTSSIANLIAGKGADLKISLREAMKAANNTAGIDIIEFNIPTSEASSSSGVYFYKIKPLTDLPSLTSAVVIDGSTQPTLGIYNNPYGPEIEIDGSSAGVGATGIEITTSNCIIEELVINNFTNRGIDIFGDQNKIYACYVGTDVIGENDEGCLNYGIYIYGSLNIIGSIESSRRNIISGNDGYGVAVAVSGSSSNEILGNYIGTNRGGVGALPNNYGGVYIFNGADLNRIGNGASSGRNVISGNSQYGVVVMGGEYNSILGNYIGANKDGDSALPNSVGILLYDGAHHNIIGPSNVIAYNSSDGVYLPGSAGNSNKITQNSIFSNSGFGINLDGGANGSISAPTISKADYNEYNAKAQIEGSAASNSVVEIFDVGTPDSSGFGEGKTYVGSANAAASGLWSVSLSGVSSGDILTTTATDNDDNTSEFSANSTVSFLSSYQPDLQIATLESGLDYVGDGILNSGGVNQTKTSSLNVDEGIIFYIKIENDGVTPEAIIVKGSNGSSGWNINYFDSKTGWNDITSAIIGAGWSCGSLGASENREIRLVVTLTDAFAPDKEILITAESINNSTRVDTVKAQIETTTIATKEYDFPDIGIVLDFPTGSTTVEPNLSAEEVTDPPGPFPAGYKLAGKIVKFTSSVERFSVPVNVTMSIEAGSKGPKVVYWNGSLWSTQGINLVSIRSRNISFTTTHFSIFAPISAIASNLVRFGPNPFSPADGNGVFWYWLDEDAATSVYLIDMSGSLIRKWSFISGANGGRSGANYFNWDGKIACGDNAGSGVYIYKIVQSSNVLGGGKIAVIR